MVAIVSAVALRLAMAGMPPDVLRAEALVIAAGVVYGAIALWIRSKPLASRTPVQLMLMAANAALAVAALGEAGPWLGNDLPPLAVAVFAAMLLYFDMGYNASHFGYVLLVAAAGLAVLWADAVINLMIPITTIATWTFVLLGLVLLAYVTHHIIDRSLLRQAGRQESLLSAISDMGEGLLVTEDGRFVTGNEAYVNLTGYTAAELLAAPSLIDLAPPEDREALARQLAARLGGGEVPVHYESALITKDGRRRQVETSIRPLTAEGPRRLLAVVRDVTDRHRSEEAGRESETRFRTLFEQSQAGMAFADLNGRLTSTNEAFRQLVGFTAAELEGVSLVELTHPEDVPLSEEVLRLLLAGETPGFRIDKRFVRKDGQSVWVDVTARMVRDPQGRALYIQTHSTGSSVSTGKSTRTVSQCVSRRHGSGPGATRQPTKPPRPR